MCLADDIMKEVLYDLWRMICPTISNRPGNVMNRAGTPVLPCRRKFSQDTRTSKDIIVISCPKLHFNCSTVVLVYYYRICLQTYVHSEDAIGNGGCWWLPFFLLNSPYYSICVLKKPIPVYRSLPVPYTVKYSSNSARFNFDRNIALFHPH